MKQNTKSIKKSNKTRTLRKPRTHRRMVRSGGKVNLLKIKEQEAEDSRRQDRAMEDDRDDTTWLQDLAFDDEGEEIAGHNVDNDDPNNYLRGIDPFASPVYDSFDELRDPNHIETHFPMVLLEYVEVMHNEELMRALQREERLINFFMDIARLITHAETDTDRELVERHLLNYRMQNYPMTANTAMNDFIPIFQQSFQSATDEDSYASDQHGGQQYKKTRKWGPTTQRKKFKPKPKPKPKSKSKPKSKPKSKTKSRTR